MGKPRYDCNTYTVWANLRMIDTYMMWVNLGRTVTPTWCGQTYIGLRHLHGVGKLRYDCNTYMVWANLGRTVIPTWCGQT